jgi:hypothetical protein
MALILELQSQAIDSNTDILTLLRKALLVARKLNLKEFDVFDSIPSLNNLLDTKEKHFISSLSGSANVSLSELFKYDTKYQIELPRNSIVNIIEQVKNKILGWALILEENGILGEGLSFSKEEKKVAQEEDKIINYVTNIYGDVSDSQIQQGTKRSKQEK